MAKVRIVTDSNSGITQAEAKTLGVSVIPMPFLINGEDYLEDVNLTQEEFYRHLEGETTVSTSQPAVATVTDLWDSLLAEGEDVEIVHIPMSSGLSESCRTAQSLAKAYGKRVCVVDNQRISVTQKQSVLDALKLAGEGKSAQEIADYLTATKLESSIYIDKKVHSLSQAKQVMAEAMRGDLNTRFKESAMQGKMRLFIAHTNFYAEAETFRKELEAIFPNIPVTLVDPLSLSVSCHIGPGALAVAASVCY